MVEPWELSFQQAVIDPDTGGRFTFMNNWTRLAKYTTGQHGQPIYPPGRRQPKDEDPPPLHFFIEPGTPSAIFRLTWESPTNSVMTMRVARLNAPSVLAVAAAGLTPGYAVLGQFNNSDYPGAYHSIDMTRREALIGIPNPAPFDPELPFPVEFILTLQQANSLGNYAIELLGQNPAPIVQANAIEALDDNEYAVYHTTLLNGVTNATTTLELAQTVPDPLKPGNRQPVGQRYPLQSLPSETGVHEFRFRADNLTLPAGDYNVVVSVDDPASEVVEEFTQQQVTVLAQATAPEPVPSFAMVPGPRSFTIVWQPSPSPDIDNHVVRYTRGKVVTESESVAAFAPNQTQGTITGLENGRSYLVTVVAMGTNGLPSRPAEVQQVVPTAGWGLNPPFIVSAPAVAATANYQYAYFPEVYDADLNTPPPMPITNAIPLPPITEPQDGFGRQWTIVSGPPGMTIHPSGLVLWTPTLQQVGDHQITLRVTKLLSLPRGGTNFPGGPLYGKQTYRLTVVGPNQAPQYSPSVARFLSQPPTVARAGGLYRYVPQVLLASGLASLVVDAGPADMMVIQEGTAPNVTNVVVWPAPTNATSQRVSLIATGTSPTEFVVQEFIISVTAPARQIPQPLVLNPAQVIPEGVVLNWVGSNASYVVQRATQLISTPSLLLDFNSPLPEGVSLAGLASWEPLPGVLNFHPNTGDAQGALFINDFAAGQSVAGFETDFRLRIIPLTSPQADGFSFNWSTGLDDTPFGEEGIGTGLTVSFDTYDNGGGEAPAIDVKWNQVTVASHPVPLSLLVNSNQFARVTIRLRPDATIDVSYAGQAIFTRLPVPAAVPLSGARFALGAQTGGLAATHTLDDLSLRLTLPGSENAWQNITPSQAAAPVDFSLDTNPPPGRAFYRVVGQ